MKNPNADLIPELPTKSTPEHLHPQRVSISFDLLEDFDTEEMYNNSRKALGLPTKENYDYPPKEHEKIMQVIIDVVVRSLRLNGPIYKEDRSIGVEVEEILIAMKKHEVPEEELLDVLSFIAILPFLILERRPTHNENDDYLFFAHAAKEYRKQYSHVFDSNENPDAIYRPMKEVFVINTAEDYKKGYEVYKETKDSGMCGPTFKFGT